MVDSKESRQLFIVRRAFWIGKVKRSELVTAFQISDNQASLDLKQAVFGRWASYLRRDGATGHSGVIPIYGVQPPVEASSSKMLSLFEHSAGFTETGLTQDELGLLVSDYPVYRANDEILDILMRSCINKCSIEILYVGLRKGESGRWRHVVACGLEFTGRQWRLIALDLNAGQKQKTYVLSRILAAKNTVLKPRNLSRINLLRDHDEYNITLNSEMTIDQLTAIDNELGSKNGKISIAYRNFYEFKKMYCDDRTGLDQLVWPVVQNIKMVTK